MPVTSNSNVYLKADAQPLPVTATVPALHSFEVENYNPWPAEIIDSVVSVVSAAGLQLDSQAGAVGTKWAPGRLGVIRQGSATNAIATIVRKAAGSFSAGEDVEVTVTFRRAAGHGLLPSAPVTMALPVNLPIA